MFGNLLFYILNILLENLRLHGHLLSLVLHSLRLELLSLVGLLHLGGSSDVPLDDVRAYESVLYAVRQDLRMDGIPAHFSIKPGSFGYFGVVGLGGVELGAGAGVVDVAERGGGDLSFLDNGDFHHFVTDHGNLDYVFFYHRNFDFASLVVNFARDLRWDWERCCLRVILVCGQFVGCAYYLRVVGWLRTCYAVLDLDLVVRKGR